MIERNFIFSKVITPKKIQNESTGKWEYPESEKFLNTLEIEFNKINATYDDLVYYVLESSFIREKLKMYLLIPEEHEKNCKNYVLNKIQNNSSKISRILSRYIKENRSKIEKDIWECSFKDGHINRINNPITINSNIIEALKIADVYVKEYVKKENEKKHKVYIERNNIKI